MTPVGVRRPLEHQSVETIEAAIVTKDLVLVLEMVVGVQENIMTDPGRLGAREWDQGVEVASAPGILEGTHDHIPVQEDDDLEVVRRIAIDVGEKSGRRRKRKKRYADY